MRYQIPESNGPSKSDVIGILRRLDDSTAWLERRDGSIAQIPRSDVLIVKVVPQRPLRRRRAKDITPEALQQICSRGWPAVESVPLGQWELRASGGFTARANSARVSGNPGIAMSDALRTVHEFYLHRSLRPTVQVIAGSSADKEITSAGWQPQDDETAMVRVLDLGHHRADENVHTSGHASEAWLHNYQRVTDLETARAVLEAPSRVAFLSIGDPPQAICRVVVSGEWAGLAAIEVPAAARGNGLASRIVEAALSMAGQAGADKAYAQVNPENEASMRLFDRLGFLDHHQYRYLVR